VIRAYDAAAAAERDEDAGDPTGAVMAIVGVTFMAELDER
jgi:hypothetical protein